MFPFSISITLFLYGIGANQNVPSVMLGYSITLFLYGIGAGICHPQNQYNNVLHYSYMELERNYLRQNKMIWKMITLFLYGIGAGLLLS